MSRDYPTLDEQYGIGAEAADAEAQAFDALVEERDSLRAKCAELEKDAARWRYLESKR